jgi:hypothetical protein
LSRSISPMLASFSTTSRARIFNLRTAVQREGFVQDFEADAVCAFPTRTLWCVERKAQAADGQKIVQNRPH